jgi:stage V sporulation protein R
MANISPELEEWRKKIEKIARGYGLDFFDTIFEMVTYQQMNQIAAYGGFPVRYPHWRFGMDYESLSKGYEYGLSKIYEMVINTDPCYAYLLEGNRMVDHKLVMAHVYGHCDFFKNNQWFSHTNRKMMDVMANHATRVRRYIDRYGQETVEDFIDKCLSLENLIDRYSPYIKKDSASDKALEENRERSKKMLNDGFTREYMDEYINPPHFQKELRERAEQQRRNDETKFPPCPERDVLLFLMHYAPLKNWQQDILSIIREEAYYYAPQGMTKIMNEGWASYWHSKIMTQDILTDAEVIDYSDVNSGTMAMSPTSFNPYKVGVELFRNIEERWNKGQFGKEWNECTNLADRKGWDKKLGLGREKIFEVRRNYNDVTFIDEFLTEEFCVENKFFVYQFNPRTQQYEINTREFPKIKKQLLFQLTNFGQPIISVEDGNFKNRGELLLTHLYEGVELQPDYMKATLENLYKIWTRPVHIATVGDQKAILASFDGKEFTETPMNDETPEGSTESSENN